jgi:hypothetical protein
LHCVCRCAFFNLGIAESVYAEPINEVSIVQLIADPERFDGQAVRMIAFLRLEFEGNTLYLHREDYEFSISRNGIWIDLTDSQLRAWKKSSNGYVIAEGVFTAKRKGHFGMWQGSLEQVKRLDQWNVRRR